MTMLSFRLPDDEAAEIQRWAEELQVDRSELLRDAVHRRLVALRSERDVERWLAAPSTAEELALGGAADWGPAEDWADWGDATR